MTILLKPRLDRVPHALLALLTVFSITAIYFVFTKSQPAPPAPPPATTVAAPPRDFEAEVSARLKEARVNDSREMVALASADYAEALKIADSATVDRRTLASMVLLQYVEFAYKRAFYKRAVDLLTRVAQTEELERDYKIKLAQSLYASGKIEQSLLHFRRILDADIAGSAEDENIARCVGGERSALACLYLRNGHEAEAKGLYLQAMHDFTTKAGGGNASERKKRAAELRLEQASNYLSVHKPEPAISILRRELRDETRNKGILVPATCDLRERLAGAYLKDKQYSRAECLYRELVERYRHTPDEANALAHAANFYWQAKKIPECEKALRHALALRRRHYSRDSAMALTLENNLSTVLSYEGHTAESEKLSLRYERACAKSKGEVSDRVRYCLYEAGNNAEGIALCKRAIASKEKDLKAAKTDDEKMQAKEGLGQWLAHQAEFCCDCGDFGTASKLLERERQIRDPLIFCPGKLVQVYMHLGQTDKAEAQLKKNLAMVESREKNPQWAYENDCVNIFSYNSIACARTELARFYLEQKRGKDAEDVLTQMLAEIADRKLRWTATAAVISGNLAHVYVKQGRFAEAADILIGLQGGSLTETFDAIDENPVRAFYSASGDAFSCSGPGSNEYLTRANQPRVDPVLVSWLWIPLCTDRKLHPHFFEENWQTLYSQSIPMIDFYDPWHDQKKVVAAANLIALANVYTASGQPEKARRQIEFALAHIKRNLEPSTGKMDGASYQGYEEILKRLPKSAETERILAEVEEKWQQQRDKEI